jgi:hypothetical protein
MKSNKTDDCEHYQLRAAVLRIRQLEEALRWHGVLIPAWDKHSAYMWECASGHLSAHTENEIRDMIVYPKCGLMFVGGVCMRPLVKRVRELPLAEGDDK